MSHGERVVLQHVHRSLLGVLVLALVVLPACEWNQVGSPWRYHGVILFLLWRQLSNRNTPRKVLALNSREVWELIGRLPAEVHRDWVDGLGDAALVPSERHARVFTLEVLDLVVGLRCFLVVQVPLLVWILAVTRRIFTSVVVC